ncbi:hypothetical protein RO07_25615 [Pandoraea pulmonicola]|uniref:Uncharacterized protein n=1 Tax=Pandoraea pulmonicola TaxID=93221 RepID=A0ABM6FSU8_PANPU|nr:hypothetical protein RO07_25615 [Pandoraea pulmonicola]
MTTTTARIRLASPDGRRNRGSGALNNGPSYFRGMPRTGAAVGSAPTMHASDVGSQGEAQ